MPDCGQYVRDPLPDGTPALPFDTLVLMKLTLCFLLMVSLFFSVEILAQEQYHQTRISIPNLASWKRLAGLGIALEEGVQFHEREVELILSSSELTKLRQNGFRYVMTRTDMETFFRNRLSEKTQDSFVDGSMGGFYTMTEALNRLHAFRTQYKTLISAPIEIGRSIQGRPIFAYRVSDNADLNEAEPEVLYTALHHAREPQSLMTLLYFMERLLRGYGTNPEFTYLLNNRQLWFVPVVNPDGYVYNQQLHPQGGGLWRKNRRANSDGSTGVDLNRNYGFKWGYDNLGSSPRDSDETYRGAARFSEPETQAIRDFVKSRKFILALNYHSFRDMLIYPWGYKAEETAQASIFQEYAAWMTRINNYGIGTSFETLGYLTNGEADDWFYGDVQEKNRILSMTPEVGGFAESFWPPKGRILKLSSENFQSNLALAWLAGGYIITKQTKAKESSGNGNGSIQPGEQATLRVTLRNLGYRHTIKNISGVVRCLNGDASLKASRVNFGDLKPFENSEKVVQVTFSRSATVLDPIQFEIVISSRGTVLRKDFFSIKLQR
jgi:hypothetical protein